MKRRAYQFINHNATCTQFIYWLIILNVFALILESYKEFRDGFGWFLHAFEVFSVLVFTVEYLIRIWVADMDPQYKGNSSIRKRLAFMFSTLGIIDLVSILPFYLPIFVKIDFRIVRILRLFRLLRIFKLTRFSRSLRAIQAVLQETKSELSITIFIAFILLVFSSTMMYYLEGDVQPDKFASIGHAFWWSIATLTTVGYGDVYPVTALGKLLSAVIALIGIGFVALPTGIISSAFVEKLQAQKRQSNTEAQHEQHQRCPHCGKLI